MMIRHDTISDKALHALLRQRKISLGGNERLKIYGTLKCRSGKQMHRKNRVFFSDEAAALSLGYRPCGHCMKQAYMSWRNGHT